MGDVKAVLSLQYTEEATNIDVAAYPKLEFTEAEKEAMKPKAPADGDGDDPPADDGGEPK